MKKLVSPSRSRRLSVDIASAGNRGFTAGQQNQSDGYWSRGGSVFARSPRRATSGDWHSEVVQFAKGYGFIQPTGGGGRDVLVHISAVEQAGCSLNEGRHVAVTTTNVFQLSQPGTFADPLTEVRRNGARALPAQAVV